MTDLENGIKKSREFLEECKVNGIKIVYQFPTYFMQNIEVWCHWFREFGINNISMTSDINSVRETDLCVIISHGFEYCKVNKYIAIQTENFTTVTHDPKSYIFAIKMFRWKDILKKATVIWDYSLSNISLLKKAGYNNVVHIPIMYSDNNKLFKNCAILMTEFINRQYDIILAANTPRRLKMTNDLKNNKFKCMNLWRTQLPFFISKTKIFLNLHAYNAVSALEIHRLLDLRNIPVVIVSEKSSDGELEKILDRIVYVEYNDIVVTCEKIIQDENLWKKHLDEQGEMWKNFEDIYKCFPKYLTEIPT